MSVFHWSSTLEPIVGKGMAFAIIDDRNRPLIVWAANFSEVFSFDAAALYGRREGERVQASISASIKAWRDVEEIAAYVQGDGTDAQRMAIADDIRARWAGVVTFLPLERPAE